MRKFEPCIPPPGKQVPAGPEWIHEIKHDGYRLIVQREGKRVRLFTRNGHDWTDRFPLIVEAALQLRNSSSMARPLCWGRTGSPISMLCMVANAMRT
jgi:ATP-dependent DNA ligase